MRNCVLVRITSDPSRSVVPFTDDFIDLRRIVVGSGEGVQLLLNNPTIRPHHMALEHLGNRWCGSLSGQETAVVNGEQVRAFELPYGIITRVQIGDVTLDIKVLVIQYSQAGSARLREEFHGNWPE